METPQMQEWRILHVDDDEDDYIITGSLLSQAKGHKVSLKWAPTYQKGIESLQTETYDAVLVDYDLGSKTGIEFIREAAALGITAPIILFTGRGSYETDVEAMQAGATLYLTKAEANILILERSIRYAIEHKQIEEDLRRANTAIQNERKLLMAVLNQMPSGVIIAEAPTGKLILGNEKVEKIWRRPYVPSPEVSGYQQYLGFHLDGRAYQPEEWPLARAVTQGEVVTNEEIRFQRGDGTFGFMSVSAAPVCDEAGQIVAGVVIFSEVTERKQVELALVESEKRYRRLVENANEGIWTIDAENKTNFINEVGAQILGYTPEEMFGRPATDFVFPEDLEPSEQRLVDRKNGVSEILDVCMRHKDGHAVWVSSTSAPILGENGEYRGAQAMFVDITERKQTEAERERLLSDNRRQRKFLERLIQEAPFAVAVLEGPEHRYRLINPLQRHLTRGKGEILGRTVADVWAECPEQILPILDRVFKTGKPFQAREIQFDMVRDKGPEKAYFSVSYTPFFDENGQVEGIIAVAVETTEEVLARRQIEAGRDKMQSLLESMDDEVWYCDLEGNVALLNEPAIIRLGIANPGREKFSLKEVVLNRLEILNLDRKPRPQEETPLYRSLRGENVRGEEIVRNLQTGDEMYRQFVSTPIRSADGEIQGAVVVVRDISDLIATQQALRESEQRFRLMGETIPYGVWFCDAEGRAIYTSQSFLNLLEMTMEEMQGFGWTHRLPAEDVQPMMERWMHCVQTGEDWDAEHRILGPDGKYHTVLTRGKPVRNEKGEITCWVGINLDIDDRKEMEERLLYQAQFLTNVHDAVIATDEQMRITTWNPGAQKLYGYSQEEALGQKIGELFQTETTEEQRSPNMDQLREEGFLSVEVLQHTKDNRQIYVDARAVPLQDARGKITGFVTANRDITERKEAEAALRHYTEQLERSNRELEEFAFSASHDLQEPLHKIAAFSDLLIDRAAGKLTSEESDYLNRMKDAAARMQKMITDLLSLSRISAQGKQFSAVDLGEVVGEVLNDLELRISQTQAQVEVSELPFIQGDRGQVHQLFLNLIGNALKFHRSEVPPHVKVYSVQKDQSDIEIIVEDNGIGFEQSDAERVFQPFKRLVGRSEFDGTGIGLAICRKIVERHGGSIRARSIPGEGSAFVVNLPLR